MIFKLWNRFSLSLFKRIFYLRAKCVLVILFLWVGMSIFYLPFRNLLYPSVIRPAWRDLATIDIIRMRYLNREEPKGLNFLLTCDALFTSTEDPFAGAKNSTCREGINNVTAERAREMLSLGLGRYLPFINWDLRMTTLRLYVIMSKALERQGVPFFLTAGSLLGAIRHGGFIPWDDDFDIGVDARNMSRARQALGCIIGVEFLRFSSFHYKFHYKGQGFPFIDVFFFETDGRYVWALTTYITSTFMYLHENVFPVQTIEFEGCISVPIPAKGLKVVNKIFHYSQCIAYDPHIDLQKTQLAEFPDGYERTNVPCKILVEFYKMNHLDA